MLLCKLWGFLGLNFFIRSSLLLFPAVCFCAHQSFKGNPNGNRLAESRQDQGAYSLEHCQITDDSNICMAE